MDKADRRIGGWMRRISGWMRQISGGRRRKTAICLLHAIQLTFSLLGLIPVLFNYAKLYQED